MSTQRTSVSEKSGDACVADRSHQRSTDVDEERERVSMPTEFPTEALGLHQRKCVEDCDTHMAEGEHSPSLAMLGGEVAAPGEKIDGARHGASDTAVPIDGTEAATQSEQTEEIGSDVGDEVEIEVSDLTSPEVSHNETLARPESEQQLQEEAADDDGPLRMPTRFTAEKEGVRSEASESHAAEAPANDVEVASGDSQPSTTANVVSEHEEDSDGVNTTDTSAATPAKMEVPASPAQTICEDNCADSMTPTTIKAEAESTTQAAGDALTAPSHATPVDGGAGVSQRSEAGTPPPPSLSDDVEEEKSVASRKRTRSTSVFERETSRATDEHACVCEGE